LLDRDPNILLCVGRSESQRGPAAEEVSTMRTIRRFLPRFDGLEGKALTSGVVGHTGHAEAVQPTVTELWGNIRGTWTSETKAGDLPYSQSFRGRGFIEGLGGDARGGGIIFFSGHSQGDSVSGTLKFTDPESGGRTLVDLNSLLGRIVFSNVQRGVSTYGDVALTETTASDGLSGTFTMVLTADRRVRHGH
jgi:hypothetical protein